MNLAQCNGAAPVQGCKRSPAKMQRGIGILVAGLAVLGNPTLAGQPPGGRSHPFLFLTPTDVARVRQAVRRDKVFARLAAELVHYAQTSRIEALPPLDRSWWETARSKPWAETYPEVFRHTWLLPARWAELARACARASLLAGGPEAAAKAKRLLLALADYSFEFEHYDVGMNYTVWAVQALEAYDILYPQFSPAERARLDAFFERWLAAVQKNDAYWVAHEPGGALNNHYAWHKLCFVAMGLFYDRPELVEQGLHGPKGVACMLQHGFKDHGLWLEGAIAYQFAATAPLVQMAELLENVRSPHSLYRWQTSDGRSLKQAYDALVPLLWPDRTLPTVGDCYGYRRHLGDYADYEVLFRRLAEPTYAWLLADRPSRSPAALFSGGPKLPAAPPPPQTSHLWPEMGYLALRSQEGVSYWTGQGWSLFATYSAQPVHEHADKLSVQLFGDGHLWLPDLEARSSAPHAFSSPVQRELNRHTLCHNTLMVDNQNQRFPARPLDLVEFRLLPTVKRASFGDLSGQLYPGVRQLRTLIVRPEYVLDFHQARADGPRQFSWLTHVNGEAPTRPAIELQPVHLPQGPPWRYLTEARVGQAGSHYTEAFAAPRDVSRPGLVLQLDLWSNQPLEIVHCRFPLDDGPRADTLPMRLARCQGSQVWFLALYRLGGAEPVPARATVQLGEMQTWQVRLQLGSQTFSHVLPRLSE